MTESDRRSCITCAKESAVYLMEAIPPTTASRRGRARAP